MIAMDLKGLSWIGNVYEKFEAMCLEVEEILYQDTVNYVENQVQTVNTSVKKFCSDVMEDLVPQSGNYSMKLGASDLPAGKYVDAGSYRKLKDGMKKEYTKFNVEKAPEDFKVITNVHENVGHVSNLHRRRKNNNLCSNSSGAFEKEVSPNLLSRQHKNKCMGLKPKTSLKESILLAERRGVAFPVENNVDMPAPSNESCSEITKALHDQVALCSTPASAEGSHFVTIDKKLKEVEKASKRTSDNSANNSSSDVIDTVESAAEKERASSISFFDSIPEEPNDLATADACDTDSVVTPSHSLENVDTKCRDSSDKVSMSCPVASDEITREQGMQDDDRNDVVNLEECVLVDGEELQFITHKLGKRKPYKKRIQGALSSFKSSGRKQEYEQLVFGNDDYIINEECATSMSTVMVEKRKNLMAYDLHDSEWELL